MTNLIFLTIIKIKDSSATTACFWRKQNIYFNSIRNHP